jgi:cell wall-associated NlpC family hydrolase
LTPANAAVAATELEGKVDAPRYVDGTSRQVCTPVLPVLATPDAKTRDRELTYGDTFRVLDEVDGYAFGQSLKDGYVGYVAAASLFDVSDPTDLVAVPSTHLYEAPNLKSKDIMALPFGARLRIVGGEGGFAETDQGAFVYKKHLRGLSSPFQDPANVAQLFFGTPYLWGGNSIWGIDCSGLVQAALRACGLDCPGDSDMQENELGLEVDGHATERGDLFFWKGHVAMAMDGDVLIHANAHHMAVAYEPITAAIQRIEAQGGGPVTSRKRI